MARWKLMEPHYLDVPGTEWEYMEHSPAGKRVRKVFPVPMHLDPRGMSKDLVVCQPGKGQPGDVEYLGPPTPGMLPIDDEAKKISAGFAAQWKHPIENAAKPFSQSLIDNFESEMSKRLAEQAATPVATPINDERLDKLMKMVEQLVQLNMHQTAELAAARAAKPGPGVAQSAGRR